MSCSCDKVSEYAANPDNAPEWQTQKPVKIGSEIALNAQFLGKQLSYVYLIAEYIPGKMLVMKTEDGPFPMETTYTWETIDVNSTRMTLRNQGNPTGFSMLLSPFVAMMMKRANNKDLKRIKYLLENVPCNSVT